MKRKLLSFVLVAALPLALLSGCGNSGQTSGGSSTGTDNTQTSDNTQANDNTQTNDNTSADSNTSAAGGSVYYLNFKPEADQAWQDLAAEYTLQTGVSVKVVTAASGTYSDTLTAEMAKSEAPTLYNIGNMSGLNDWNDYALDLSGTAIYDERVNDDYVLFDETGAPKALGYCYESFGIIVNKALLDEAGYSLDDITDFASLKDVADDIHARADELGFDAFSAPGLDGSSSWRFSGHLANVPLFYEFRDDNVTEQPATITGAYLDNFRNIWDLYITDTAATPTSLATSTGDESEAEFGNGKAVFYQNGDWEFSNLTSNFGMSADDLAMIPIYCGVAGEEKAGLNSGTENCWAVNSQASEENIQATLDFMYWVVTSDEGTSMLAEQFSGIPFKNAKDSNNVFGADANEYASAGNYTLSWAFNHTPNVDSWRATVVTALAAYSASPSDANWDAVVQAFVDGWAIEYTAENG
ncbi:MAG: ABC transporter substrate-binding protein [Lachnospiraceae bacterium]|nr:ABC transporter substrate-binding protein [Lachnospiraceae bacterium]